MSTMTAAHIAISIARDWREVAGYLAAPVNFNAWAAGLGSSLHEEGGVWLAQGPTGPVRVRFSPANVFGIADHWVELAPDTVVYVPLRVVANATGAEVVLTLFRLPTMSDADFATDAGLVRCDLARLKAILES